MNDSSRTRPRTDADPLPDLADFFPLNEVPRRVSPAASGKPVHISAPHRWVARGILGVKLRVVVLGGRRLTTSAWLVQFARDVAEARDRANAPAPTRRPARRRATR